MNSKMEFLEFFAGGGLARLGLGDHWKCTFANDICPKKADSYRRNFKGAPEFQSGDVWQQEAGKIPGHPELAWASFPCQDLSLAGNGNGLAAHRSGSFWGFWKLIVELSAQSRRVPIVVLENVVGLLSSKGGQDFVSLCRSIAEQKYRVGAMVIDAVRFVPQSRPRLFIVAYDQSAPLDGDHAGRFPDRYWYSEKLLRAYTRLPEDVKRNWVWWSLPHPPSMNKSLADVLLDDSKVESWHSKAETQKMLGQMSKVNLDKVRSAQQSPAPVVGTIYKRTRIEDGIRLQRAEVRFDGISGCLRTPAGGSSRQTVILVDKKDIRTRLLAPREAARLMGVRESYILPANYNEAYHLMGDAVAVPAVRWLSQRLLHPLALRQTKMAGAA